jgi:hypothetical protein
MKAGDPQTYTVESVDCVQKNGNEFVCSIGARNKESKGLDRGNAKYVCSDGECVLSGEIAYKESDKTKQYEEDKLAAEREAEEKEAQATAEMVETKVREQEEWIERSVEKNARKLNEGIDPKVTADCSTDAEDVMSEPRVEFDCTVDEIDLAGLYTDEYSVRYEVVCTDYFLSCRWKNLDF